MHVTQKELGAFLRKDCAFYSSPLNRSVSILHHAFYIVRSNKIDAKSFAKMNYKMKNVMRLYLSLIFS